MDPSVGQPDDGTQSPTQVNEGRSYDRYAENPASLESLGIRQTQEQAGFSDDFLAQALDENDSGAVRFDSLYSGGPEADIEAESPTAGESQFGKQRVNGMACFFPNPDNDPVSTTAGPEPETPAAPKNPFAAFAGKFQTPLVAKSQLFAQTPVTAGFGNQVSPTWSRPSPSDLPMHAAATPYTGGSSVLRPQFPNSMLHDLQTPMPEPTFHNLETSSQSRPDTITPYPNRPAAPDALQQSSSPIARRRRATAPIKDYEPMKKSQERREASIGSRARLGSFDSSSDDDAGTTSRRRQNIVQKKKQEATKMLSAISMSGPAFRNDVIEVPSSTRKEERPRSRGLRSSSQAPEERPERGPHDAPSEPVPETTEKPFDGPRSSVPESEYGHLSFPQSMIDAEYGTKPLPASKTPTSSANYLPEISDTIRQQPRQVLQPHSSINEADAIPETSPARIRASATMPSPANVPSGAAETASFPPSADLNFISSQALLDLPSPARPRNNQQDKIGEVVGLLKQRAQQDREAIDLATSSPPVPAPEIISRKRRRRVDNVNDEVASNSGRPSRAASRAASASSGRSAASALSSLSVTPTQTSRTETPITANDSDRSAHLSDKKDGAATTSTISGIDIIDIPDDSPLLPRRRRRDHMLPLPTAKQEGHAYTRQSASVSTFSMRRGPSPVPSGSTDELAVSPVSMTAGSDRRTRSTRNFARSASYRGAALAPTSHRRESAAPGLFAGMLFSVTFQSKRKGESDADFSKREKQGEKLQAKIVDGGGSILPDGFDALFQPAQFSTGTASRYRNGTDPTSTSTSRNRLRLLPQGTETGFTALISDGHSRKAKYMQALALGLPCLAPRWVTTCIERNELVDWSPYLLCAGESSFLGGAIRSRNLVSYDAHAAQLVDIVDARSKLLDGLNILVFLRRSTREAYVFLAHVLGANLSRAHTTQEARDQLRAMEDAGRAFDWVYTDEEADINGIFNDRASSRPAAKRRKRASSALLATHTSTHADGDRPPAPVKLLSDERFIQSLIFGKLIEEDDLGD